MLFCDKKFTFNHKCPNRQLLFLQLVEHTTDFIVRDCEEHSMVDSEEPISAKDQHLSLNALKGGLGVGTIRFVAHIDQLPITVLIDGGALIIFSSQEWLTF